jgi:hypothetical protein
MANFFLETSLGTSANTQFGENTPFQQATKKNDRVLNSDTCVNLFQF